MCASVRTSGKRVAHSSGDAGAVPVKLQAFHSALSLFFHDGHSRDRIYVTSKQESVMDTSL